MIGSRDLDYIEDRLLAPSVAATEAGERLTIIGQPILAERLLEAHSAFIEECRSIRRVLADIYQAERRAAR